MKQFSKSLGRGIEPYSALFRNRVFSASVPNRDLNRHAIHYSEAVPIRDLKAVNYGLMLSLIENKFNTN